MKEIIWTTTITASVTTIAVAAIIFAGTIISAWHVFSAFSILSWWSFDKWTGWISFPSCYLFLNFFFEVIVLFYWFFIIYLQRVSSQERENSVKKFSCLPPGSYTREDSQTPIRSSTNVVRKWNPASAPDQRCKLPHCGMIRHFWHSVPFYHIHTKKNPENNCWLYYGMNTKILFILQVRLVRNLNVGLAW